MTAIAGIVPGGGDEGSRLVRRMIEAAAYRGADFGCWSSEAASIAQRGGEPAHDRASGLAVVLDGRLDNRDELLRSLDLARSGPRSPADAQLLLAGYLRWGEGLPDRLLGDFAFAIWDGRERSLLCARDALGVRPFYFSTAGGRFAFATELRQLLLLPWVPDPLNEGVVAEYLAWRIRSPGETLYREVQRLPAATALRVRDGGAVQTWRYWEVRDFPGSGPVQARQCAERLRDILSATVASRLRGVSRPGVQLSGGLDSSSVALIAAQAARGSPGTSVEALAVAYPGLPCDESAFIRVAARHAGIQVRVGQYGDLPASAYARRAGEWRDFPGYPMTATMLASLGGIAREAGRRVLLTGEGGDEVLGGDADGLADLLRRGNLMTAWRESGPVGGLQGLSRTRAFLRHGVKPWLARLLRDPGLLRHRPPALPWLSARWAATIDLRERLAELPVRPEWVSCAQESLFRSLTDAHALHFLEMLDLDAAREGLELRHPFLDRRLVEFVLALPTERLLPKGRSKHLLREAMCGDLAAETLDPGTRVDFGAVMVRALDAILCAGPVAAWPVAQAGWVEPGALEARYQAARVDLLAGRPFAGTAIWSLWMAYGVGLLVH